MNVENRLPKEVLLAGERFSGRREASERRTGGPEQQAKVKALLDKSPVFTDLTEAVRQAMEDREKERWSHVLTPWDGTEKYWVVREADPNYKYVCFSGLRCVVPAATTDVAWEALTTDTIEEV